MTPDPYKANTGGPGDVADPGSWNRYVSAGENGSHFGRRKPEPVRPGPVKAPQAPTLPNGSADQQVAQDRNLTVGSVFAAPNSQVTAYSSVNGPQVWINPSLINPADALGDAALIAHETLHNLGLLDPTIQADLGITVDPRNTKNISDKLQQDCFPGYSGPTLLP